MIKTVETYEKEACCKGYYKFAQLIRTNSTSNKLKVGKRDSDFN